jgi:hypothetical protein
MSTHLDTDFSPIATADLSIVTGGSSDPGNDYVTTLKSDLIRQGGHTLNAIDAAQKGNWMHAGGEALRTGVDMLETVKDGVKPLAPFWDFTKDAVSTITSLKK